MRKLNVSIVTGTRAEFGIWTPVLRALQKSKKLNPQLVVTGMHLQKQFGHTLNDIKKSGIPIAAAVTMYKKSDTPAASLARATAGLARTYRELKSDLVMVLGDRLEILAAANAALACQLPLAHVHGGETAPGQWDEQIRHAVTKIAHLHFCATKKAAERIEQMGEDPKTIYITGAPALDTITHFLKAANAERRMANDSVLLLLHPSSPDDQLEYERTLLTIQALKNSRLLFTAIGPNNDPGYAGILRAYQKTNTHLTMNLSQTDYWRLLLRFRLLIGNSSSAVIESASFGVPAINLGDRQKGRERNVNVIDIPWGAGANGIERAIRRALTNKLFRKKVAQRKNLYGDGYAADRLAKILESLKFPLTTIKQFRLLPFEGQS